MLYQMDLYLFRLLNNLTGQSKVLDWFFYFFAVHLIFVLAGLAAGLFVYYLVFRRLNPPLSPFKKGGLSPASCGARGILKRGGKGGLSKSFQFLFLLVATPILAYFLKILINLIYFRPRPFVVLGDVHQMLFKSPLDSSFPSAHTTIAFALAFAVFWKNKVWGTIFFVLAVLVGLGRIFAGVHYPMDIVAGIVIAFLASLSSARISKRFFIPKRFAPGSRPKA